MVDVGLLDTQQARRHARDTLQTFLTAQEEVQTVRILEVIKANDKTWVATALINGEKVVIKRYLGAHTAKTILRLRDELSLLEQVFGAGTHQVNKCLMSWPDEGIAVLSFAPGQRLDDAIAKARGPGRERLLTHSGAWLAKYTQGRRKDGSFGPAYWIKRVRNRNRDHIDDPDDLRLLDRLMDALKQQKPRLNGCPVVQAASHGDYVGMNAHYHAGIIYGVDIQGECRIPLARDCARFLVWLQIHDKARPDDRTHGIATPTWTGFLKSDVLSVQEQDTTLPFFVGEQLYYRFVNDYRRARIRSNAAAAIESYLQAADG